MRLPLPVARALTWVSTRRRVVLPALFAALVLVNLAVAATLSQPFSTGVSVQVAPPSPEDDPDAPPPDVDTDADGVSDLDELYLYGTDRTRSDTDGDGASDLWEAENRLFDDLSGEFRPDPVVADGDQDPDGDDLTNLEESHADTDPNVADSEGDGLPDGWEVHNDLDPLAANADADTDGDGATDTEEFERGTHPARVDSDLDGLPDAVEVGLGTDPARYSTAGSGVADGWLVAFDLDPLDAEIPYVDADSDGLTAQDEFNWSKRRLDFEQDLDEENARLNFRRGLDPAKADTDGDGAGDGWEARYQLDPLQAGDGGDDLDADGLANLDEFAADADPRKADTDGDGLDDLAEAKTGWKIRLDEREVQVFSDPSRRDSDGDGLSDVEEKQGFAVRNGARVDFCAEGPCALAPRNPDTDLDGLADGVEILYEVTPRLVPLVADTDGDGLFDGAEVRFWEERGRTLSAEAAGRLIEERAAADGVRLTPQQVREEVAPAGDVDGDGLPNVVDPDSDGDRLQDGVEAKPGTWRSQPGSDLRFLFPATDPLFQDSDGDRLVDAWEKENTRWDADCGGWNLDPSKINSFLGCTLKNDGKSDADRDLDADGVRYEAAGYRERRTYVFTNILEQAAGTDPNDPDTDGDRITDGWETHFTDLGRRLGVPVKLDATEGADANDTSKTLRYVRFAGDAEGSVEPRATEEIADVYADIGLPDGGSQNVVKLVGEHPVSYLDEFLASTDPTSDDTDGDGLPDAWEFFWTDLGGYLVTDTTNPFAPLVDTSAKDPDQDTLTNLQEAAVLDAEDRFGLNPLLADTDLGGITDEKELGELGPEGPLDPRNDNLDLDADGDGLTNGEEAFTYLTSPSLVDTDRDGLLDGGDVDLDVSKIADAAKARRFDAAGVVAKPLSTTTWRYLGEGRTDRADRTDPTKADSDGDGLPDGWETYYRLPARIFTAGATSDSDGLDDRTEYRLGMPSSWDARRTWWFGGDPTQRDSDGDGGADGGFDRSGRKVGDDLDYDNDGLNDFNGEDPHPFYDHNDTGTVRVDDPAIQRAWAVRGGRGATYQLDKDRDRIPDGVDQAPTAFRDLAIAFPGADGVLPKGGAVRVTGRLVAVTADGDRPVARGVVVANLDEVSPDATKALGVAVTGSDGTFALEVAANRTRAYTVPAGGNVTLFGDRVGGGEEVAWSVNTSLLQPKATDRRVLLWNYGVSAVEGRLSIPRVGCATLQATFAVDCSGTFTAEGVRSSFGAATDVGRAVKLKTATDFELPAGGGALRAENGGNLTGQGRLVDAAGDGVPSKPVTLVWRGASKSATTAADGTFPISFPAGTFDEPGLYDLAAEFVGDGDNVYRSVAKTGKVSVAFDTRLRATVKNEAFVVAAGTPLVVEGNLTDYRGRPVVNASVDVGFLAAAASNRTRDDGSFTVLVPAPDDVLAGTQAVTVTFAGDALHKSSSLARPIYVTVKQKTQFAIQGGDRPLTEALVVEGVLLDAANATVRDPTSRDPLKVQVTGPDFVVESEVNENGVFVAVVPSERLRGVGDYPVVLRFPGSPLYAPNSLVVPYRIVSATGFDIPEARLPRGTTSDVVGRLVDGRGDGIPSASVAVSFDERSLGTFLTNGTGHFRAPVVVPPAAELGPVRIRATYNGTGDGLYAPAAPGAATYHVVARTRLILPPRDVPTGEFVLNGTLIDDGGAAVGGEEVRLRFEGVELPRARTDFEGAFEVVVDPSCLGASACGGKVLARTYTVRASYPGSTVFAPAEAQTTVRVLARTDVVVDHVSEVARGHDVLVRGRLLQEDGLGIPRATLVASVGGVERNVTLGRVLTLPNGSFEIKGPLPADFPRGPAPLRVAYAGDANRRAAEEIVIVDVVAPTTIQLRLPNRLDVGDSFTGTIVLVDDEGHPVPDAVIRVRFSGYPYPFTLKTNATGETSFPGRIEGTGSSEVSVRFAGGGPLLGATESSRIQVGTTGVLAPTNRAWAVAVVGALVAVAAVAVLVQRYRRAEQREIRRWLGEAEAGLLAGNEYVATILTAYKRLSEHFVRYGYVPRPDVTSREFVDAARKALPVRQGPLEDLVRLFDEARYSDHPVGPAERDAAVRALAAINRDLVGRARKEGTA